MDIGAEISKKIQMAITAKLKELSAYVDDELPDYIMIMVANRKTEDQMTDALSLFLSDNTRTFTSWLHNLLAALRKAKGGKTDGAAKTNESAMATDESRTENLIVTDNVDGTTKEVHTAKDNLAPEQHVKTPPQKAEVRSKESLPSEAIISINPETDDMLDEELMLHQNDTSISHDSAPDVETGDVPAQNKPATVSPDDQQQTETDKKGLVDYSEGDKDENETQESDKRLSAGKHRRESGSKSSDRKRKSDDLRSRRSHRSRSPATKSRRDDKSRDKKDTKSRSPPRRRKHDLRRVYGLESDSKQYTKTAERTERKTSGGEPQIREWDKGKGEDGDREILSSWDRRQREADSRTKSKDDGEWSSADDEDASSKRKGSVASAVKPVLQDIEFVSESESDGDGGPRKTSAVTSKVAYPERKMRVPLAKQANKNLLIKAVSEAENSVRRKRSAHLTEVEDTTVYSQPKRNQKGRSSAREREEWVEKPVKTRRKSRDDKAGNGVIDKIMSRPMYQDTEGAEKRSKKRKEVIIVRKNVLTGDRVSMTSKQDVKETETKELKRKKYHQKPAKVILLEDGDEDRPLTVIHVRRKNQAKKRDQVIYVEGSSSEDEKYFRRDKRNFIHRKRSPDSGGEGNSDKARSSVKFDSRQAKPHSGDTPPPQPKEVRKKPKATAKVSPRPHSVAPTTDKPSTSKETFKTLNLKAESFQSPQFIVTLDGVASSSQDSTKAVPSTQSFKFNPVTAPAVDLSAKNSSHMPLTAMAKHRPIQKPVVIEAGEHEDDHDDFSGEVSDTELGKMRQKLLKVQEEATKLKQMQAKLAAAQAQRRELLKPGGMYSDKIESEQRSIYIANVNYSTTEKQLSEYFSICGKVERLTILKDSFTGHPKGFAYLEFDDKRAVSSALALDNTCLNNRVIRVMLKQARPAVPAAFYAPRGGKFLPRRPPSYRQTNSYFRGRFTPRAPRYQSRGLASVKFQSRNKTWVNPSLSGQK